ncbi:MAG: hypothetical protein JRJ87_15550 [Deltaproteobacteria bacterium]|nr:hypothetical protein [Deltaproteobacteria bacterium]
MIKQLAFCLLIMGLACTACRHADPHSPMTIIDELEKAFSGKDIGLVMVSVDIHYQDELGGPGRLEDDLRQLFIVYGSLLLDLQDVTMRAEKVSGHAVVEGKRLRFEGPWELLFKTNHNGLVVSSGLLTDLRGIISTLRERRIAIESGMPQRLSRYVSVDYRGESGGKPELLARVTADLKAVQAQAFIVDDLNIVVGGDKAKVIQSFLLINIVGEKKIKNRSRERILMQKEGSLWRITGGLG